MLRVGQSLDSRQTGVVSHLLNTRRRMPLSHDLALVYVLHRSGCVGRLNSGRVSRDGATGLNVYDLYGRLIEYLSGSTSRVSIGKRRGSLGRSFARE
jgi:hypothetical protein